MDTSNITVAKEKKAKGFNARKGEIKEINETGKTVIVRKIKNMVDGLSPEQCPLGKVGRKVWWREHNHMRATKALIHSVITNVEIGVDSKNRPAWVVSVEKV